MTTRRKKTAATHHRQRKKPKLMCIYKILTSQGSGDPFETDRASVLFYDLLVGFGVHELGHDFARVSTGIRVIGVSAGLLLGALLSAVSAKDVLVMVEIVVFVFVRVLFRHVNSGGLNDEAALND